MDRSTSSTCVICDATLRGRQSRFCSRRCKNIDTNRRHQPYAVQLARGRARKLAVLGEHGFKCRRCGYGRNFAALVWHHEDPSQKSFELDLRAFSNRTESAIRLEVDKCVLLCANCHAEVHHPHCVIE